MERLPQNTIVVVLLTGALVALTAGIVGVRLSIGLPARGLLTIFLLNVAYWAIWTLLTPAVLYFGARFRFVAGRRLEALAVHVVSSAVFVTVHVLLNVLAAVTIRSLVLGGTFPGLWQQVAQFPTRMHIEWEVTTYWALVGLAHALAFSREAQERALAAASLEAKLARAQLQVLQRQLQPHFLFNTLQSISALVHRDSRAADRMLEQLADLLRLTLRAGETAEVSLARELQHTRHYLDIEQANMGPRLRIVIDVASHALGAAVPSLLLQPIVENAIRHGLAPRVAGGTLKILGRRNGRFVELQVIDDGVGLKAASGSTAGIGIENTRQRLEQLYGARQTFKLSPNPGGGVTVTIRLPYREMAAPQTEELATWRV